MGKKYEKVACKPINGSLTLENSGVKQIGSGKNDSISSLSIEKKGKK